LTIYFNITIKYIPTKFLWILLFLPLRVLVADLILQQFELQTINNVTFNPLHLDIFSEERS